MTICKERSVAGTFTSSHFFLLLPFVLLFAGCRPAEEEARWNEYVQVVLDSLPRLTHAREGRLPLYLGRMATGDLDKAEAEDLLRELDARGIGITSTWAPDITREGTRRGLTIARAQRDLGLRINIDANRLLNFFYTGDTATAHIDAQGVPFFDESFGSKRPMGCPFAIDSRKREIRERVEHYARTYEKAGLDVDFVFADWEIDGPLETNHAFRASQRCSRCRQHLGDHPGFEDFQRTMREMRSYLQYHTYSAPILSRFPEALVGNYGVYPCDGYRYWYDFFEYYARPHPYRADQHAKYRKWHDEFPATGYTCAMPVVYTWYPIFDYYDFEAPDYRWFYNMLLVASNAGKHTPRSIPIVGYVTWHTVWVKFGGGYRDPDPGTLQMSEAGYQELLWHMLLRGTDTFKVYSAGIREFPKEARLVHEVYTAAQQYGEFLEKGSPINFEVPAEPGTVVSGLLLEDRVLVRRTDFGNSREPVEIMAGTTPVRVEYSPGKCNILNMKEL